ncbi:hypothetical protein Bca52824_041041 [Brassica carinata]|uniref:Mitochondrial adenine nucleotide transporter BTL1 n=1 Tax=Brassica carinata TaxID=52824 RepID=A0A8X7RUM1_BRACI|nr:hypothetical protein Bca52824_041041 [Brassica carinata]
MTMVVPKEGFVVKAKESISSSPSESPLRLQPQFPDLTIPVKEFFKSREAREFLSGALAGAMTKAVLAPLETIRTRMIVGVGSKTIPGSFLEIVQKQGWVAQEKLKKIEKEKIEVFGVSFSPSISWISPVAVAGAAAGIASTLVCHPLEVIKDRLTVSPELYPSLRVAVPRILRDDGIRGFYAGLGPTLVGMLPYSTCYYFMYDTMKTTYCKSKNKKALNRPEMLLLGALAGLTASTISFPLEVARKRLMVGALKGSVHQTWLLAIAK